jgi:hypothetical protein
MFGRNSHEVKGEWTGITCTGSENLMVTDNLGDLATVGRLTTVAGDRKNSS